MQKPHRISLNALRVFDVAARHLSLKGAAQELNLSPGAVSHQVRHLEDSLGIALFERRNNGISLTTSGAELSRSVASGLSSLHGALENVLRSEQELSLSISMSFATRFLLPRLGDFKDRHPGAQIHFDSHFGVAGEILPQADLSIVYVRHGDVSPGADILFEDFCRPYLSPTLLPQTGDTDPIRTLPALQCAQNNWDWKCWLAGCGLSEDNLNFGARFDLDETALHAAIAGMGMMLTCERMVIADVAAGRLTALPGADSVCIGYYILQRGGRETGLAEQFVRWLRLQVRETSV